MNTAPLVAVKNFLFPSFARTRHGLTHACVCLSLFFAWSTPANDEAFKTTPTATRVRVSESEMDAALQRAAEGALDGREGAIIVMDAQTGRVRAAVNSHASDTAAYPPGSTIKPFTLLAALRARAINADARLSCRKHYARRGAEFTCTHPVYNPPFNSAEALAHSCNYYFARLAERLPHDAFDATLAAYGFGARPLGTTTTTAQSIEKLKTTQASFVKKTPAAALPRIPRGAWQVGTALGEGDELLVSPAQLISAYAALFNGGHLYAPHAALPEQFHARELARLDITTEERTLLLAGMRGAIKYGTAAPAELAQLPSYVFGKTGTATEIDSLHTHGWFVGFAAERESSGVAVAAATHAPAHAYEPAPAEVKLAVLVFLKRGQGKQSAELARPVFAAHARLATGTEPSQPHANPSRDTYNFDDTTRDANDAARDANGATLVRVRLANGELTRTLALDDYLFGVLAAESSVEDEFAALKAQAVVSRTYALSNLRRHARDGYDLCTTTHCQRFIQITRENARPDFHELVRRAVADTRGEVLRDARGSLATDVFFSTSCGGQTANIQTLWGTRAREPYLRGVRDEYCNAMPHTHWTDAIPAKRLAKALHADERTDVGMRVDALRVVKRDATGRVEQIALAGERRRVVVRGWDFKIVVGRTLGWSVIKSSRFDVVRAGDTFLFRGSGFGHGLGLCQSGAHVMAARGSSYRQILAYYFPATTVGGASAAQLKNAAQLQTQARSAPPSELHEKAAIENPTRRTASFAHAEFVQSGFAPYNAVHANLAHVNVAHDNVVHTNVAHAHLAHAYVAASPLESARLTLSSANFRVNYPARGAREARREVEGALAVLEAVRADVRQRLSAASLASPALGVLEAFVHETTGDFTGATGKPAWVAAVTNNRRIELQPLATLKRRGLLAPTLRHEYTHAVINALSRGRAPLWLSEGLAAHVAGEGARLTRFAPKQKLSLEDLERKLAQPASADEMRVLYGAAFREVNALIQTEGEANVWRRIARGG
ncbi:MAG TPA: SpoIID/LytB domain-containing protein [Pyrinomonadaceae bacterium]|nr:SpoIID/LytB domain-containing protein [Pyrinomonadaceae bacterium]